MHHTATLLWFTVNYDYRVLAVDLDPQGNLTDSLGVDIYNDLATLYDVFRADLKAEDVLHVIENGDSPFDLLPANLNLASADSEFTQTGKEFMLKEALASLEDSYDFIIADTPPNLGIMALTAFTWADEVLIPSVATTFATSGIVQLQKTIMRVKSYFNNSLRIAGMLITRYNPRINISKEIKTLADTVSGNLGIEIFDTYIRASVGVDESHANRIALVTFQKSNAVAADYCCFVDEYLRKRGMA